jgi:hypothetical protein
MRAQGVIAKSRQVMVLAPSAMPRSENTAKSPSRSGGSWYLSHPRGVSAGFALQAFSTRAQQLPTR